MSFRYLNHSRLDDEKTNNAGMNQEVREFQTKISGLTSRNVELESANSSLQKRMADLLKDMEDKEANFRNEMARKVNENLNISFGKITKLSYTNINSLDNRYCSL